MYCTIKKYLSSMCFKVKRVLILSFMMACSSIMFAQDIPGQYREKFSESFPIREQQHLDLKRYIDLLVEEGKVKSLSRFTPDYSGIKQYEKSIIPFREQLAESFGYPPPLATKGSEPRKVFVGKDSVCNIYRIWIGVAEGVEAYGLYMVPHNITGKAPLLICEHGGGGNPEAICDLDTRINYHSFGHEAVKRGYIVWAPGLIMRCGYGGDPEIEGANRNLLDRRLKLLGTSIIGMELQMIIEGTKTLARHHPEIDSERIGMTGLSWGGFYTLHVAALFPEIKVAVPSANFRDHELVLDRVDDTKKGVDRNLFNLFGSAQVAGMICPRPLMIQMGAEDTLFDLEGVRREAKRAAVHYEKLGIGDLFEYSEHSGGHVFENESIFQFFEKHL
jgi:dienelactone hydrolase